MQERTEVSVVIRVVVRDADESEVCEVHSGTADLMRDTIAGIDHVDPSFDFDRLRRSGARLLRRRSSGGAEEVQAGLGGALGPRTGDRRR
ncbi:hypothetical protein GCM10023171_30710 [Microbacterium panaciterrae]|uniref:Uncharacterized protein n=1 Tax=Microbacterium panaciterrae TaxID=985759 RepID=A0ABP8PNC6_9MICO